MKNEQPDLSAWGVSSKKFKKIQQNAEAYADAQVKKREENKVIRAQEQEKKGRQKLMSDGSSFDKESMSRGAGLRHIGAGGRTRIERQDSVN